MEGVFAHPEGGQGEAPTAAAAPPSGGWNRVSLAPAVCLGGLSCELLGDDDWQ